MAEHRILDDIDRCLAVMDAGLMDAEAEFTPVEFDGEDLTPDDLPRAEDLLTRIMELQGRVEGLKTRVAGEMAGLRGRITREPRRPSPQSVDFTV